MENKTKLNENKDHFGFVYLFVFVSKILNLSQFSF